MSMPRYHTSTTTLATSTLATSTPENGWFAATAFISTRTPLVSALHGCSYISALVPPLTPALPPPCPCPYSSLLSSSLFLPPMVLCPYSHSSLLSSPVFVNGLIWVRRLQHQVSELHKDVHPLHGPYAENFEGMEVMSLLCSSLRSHSCYSPVAALTLLTSLHSTQRHSRAWTTHNPPRHCSHNPHFSAPRSNYAHPSTTLLSPQRHSRACDCCVSYADSAACVHISLTAPCAHHIDSAASTQCCADSTVCVQELLEELFVRFEQTWSAGQEQNAKLTQALRGAPVAAELPNQLWYLSQLHDMD